MPTRLFHVGQRPSQKHQCIAATYWHSTKTNRSIGRPNPVNRVFRVASIPHSISFAVVFLVFIGQSFVQVQGSCYEAQTSMYGCSGYENCGYTCLNGWCAYSGSRGCLCDCNRCSQYWPSKIYDSGTSRCINPPPPPATAAPTTTARTAAPATTAAAPPAATTAQQGPKDGCALGANIPYPTPVVNIAGVSVSATEYFNNMKCSFIVKLPSSDPPAFDSILTFSQFQTEQNYDFVEVYNGCDPSRSRSGNPSIPPCSLVSDFPFQLFLKSGLFRFVFFGSANKSWRTSLQHQSYFAGFLPSAVTYPSPSPPPHPWCWFSFVPTYPSYPKDSLHHWLSRARGRMDLSPSFQILT
jgi:hypothetical protein